MNQKTHTFPTVLSIAGFDSSGGAGLQADIKTISALGCYATSVLTALPIQNTLGVQAIYPIPAAVTAAQLQAVWEDIPPHAIKIGMLHSRAHIEAIATALPADTDIPIILDPVMVSSSGKRLLNPDAIQAMRRLLFPRVTLLTPNMDEASVLADMPVHDPEDMQLAARELLRQGCPAVLVKGGHLPGAQLHSFYAAASGSEQVFTQPKIDSHNTHGTGCTLSAAIAAFLAKGQILNEAVARAQAFVHQAILASKGIQIGHGNGSLNHFFDPQVMHPINLI